MPTTADAVCGPRLLFALGSSSSGPLPRSLSAFYRLFSAVGNGERAKTEPNGVPPPPRRLAAKSERAVRGV